MRIISGEFRGHRLTAPAGKTTRPITDRVKEALFTILAPRLPGAQVADLFCGTGSLGLEALSRGAAHCRFADRDRDALARLKRNIDTLGVEQRATVWPGDILDTLRHRLEGETALDIIFLDPPYPMTRQWLEDPARTRRAVARVFAPLAAVLAADGVLVLRAPRDLAVPEQLGTLALRRRKEYGSTALAFCERL